MSTVLYLDNKYIMLMSFRFRNFKKKKDGYNFSCPYCGDSRKNLKKARGYSYPYKGKLIFHCHNCGVHTSFSNLLKEFDQNLYKEYLTEKLLDQKPVIRTDVEDFAYKMKAPVYAKYSLKDLIKVSKLPQSSFTKLYVEGRQIPSKFHHELFYCEKFKQWSNSMVPGSFESEEIDEPRLVIPFLTYDKKMFGFQGRSLKSNSNLRYITIMINEDMPKLYGLNHIDLNKRINVVEGPIDSLFCDNCIASAGGSLISNLSYISNDPEKFIVIYDNEPRNIYTIKKIEKAIQNKFPVVIWPENIKEKDINNMILAGYSQLDIADIIKQNTHTGLMASLKLQMWRKV